MTQTNDIKNACNPRHKRTLAYNSIHKKLAVQCFASTFVVKVANFL